MRPECVLCGATRTSGGSYFTADHRSSASVLAFAPVAQILIRQLDDDVKAGLQRRARAHGRSMEEEARDILRNAVRDEDQAPTRLGSRMKARFARIGLDEPIAELRGQPVTPARFEP